MSDTNNYNIIETVRKHHADLYPKAVQKESNKDAITSLVAELKCAAQHVQTLEDYRWITDALLRWQVLVTNIFDEPIDTEMPPPPAKLAPPPAAQRYHTDSEIEDWLSKHAEHRSAVRRSIVRKLSTPQEIKEDWHFAKVFLARDVLEGKVNFASRVGRSTYPLLEEVWLNEVKLLIAYLTWKGHVEGVVPTADEMEQDYFDAVNHIRNLLVNKGIKATVDEFEPIRQYIEERYLDDGKLSTDLKRHAHGLVAAKANRIFEVTGEKDSFKNWVAAVTYSQLFYNNIVTATLDRDEEATLHVLKAFQFSRAPENNYVIVNAWEAILAIYFLDLDIVSKLWNEADTLPQSDAIIISSVPVEVWPSDFIIPSSCNGAFWYSDGFIWFRGVMSSRQKQDLVEKIDREAAEAIKHLYIRSRLIHRDTTL